MVSNCKRKLESPPPGHVAGAGEGSKPRLGKDRNVYR
jgi:hypothetical protein